MDCREFVAFLSKYAVTDTVNSTMQTLENPIKRTPARSPVIGEDRVSIFFAKVGERERRRTEWFRRLAAEDKETLREVLEDCAELSLFSVFTVLDGVTECSNDFELTAIDRNNHHTVIRDENSEMLHDLLADVMNETRI